MVLSSTHMYQDLLRIRSVPTMGEARWAAVLAL